MGMNRPKRRQRDRWTDGGKEKFPPKHVHVSWKFTQWLLFSAHPVSNVDDAAASAAVKVHTRPTKLRNSSVLCNAMLKCTVLCCYSTGCATMEVNVVIFCVCISMAFIFPLIHIWIFDLVYIYVSQSSPSQAKWNGSNLELLSPKIGIDLEYGNENRRAHATDEKKRNIFKKKYCSFSLYYFFQYTRKNVFRKPKMGTVFTAREIEWKKNRLNCSKLCEEPTKKKTTTITT